MESIDGPFSCSKMFMNVKLSLKLVADSREFITLQNPSDKAWVKPCHIQ